MGPGAPMYMPSPGMPPGAPVAGPVVPSKVAVPAIVLMVINGLGMLVQMASMAAAIIAIAGGAHSSSGRSTSTGIQLFFENGGATMVMGLVGLGMGSFIMWGLWHMKTLRSHSMAMAGVILGMIPCFGPMWCMGLPLGIWGLIVLSDSQVKASFNANRN